VIWQYAHFIRCFQGIHAHPSSGIRHHDAPPAPTCSPCSSLHAFESVPISGNLWIAFLCFLSLLWPFLALSSFRYPIRVIRVIRGRSPFRHPRIHSAKIGTDPRIGLSAVFFVWWRRCVVARGRFSPAVRFTHRRWRPILAAPLPPPVRGALADAISHVRAMACTAVAICTQSPGDPLGPPLGGGGVGPPLLTRCGGAFRRKQSACLRSPKIMRILFAERKPLLNLNLSLSNIASTPLLWGDVFSRVP